jgi:hypothetical protein
MSSKDPFKKRFSVPRPLSQPKYRLLMVLHKLPVEVTFDTKLPLINNFPPIVDF